MDGVAAVIASTRLSNPNVDLVFHLLVPAEELNIFRRIVRFSQTLSASCIVDGFDDRRIADWPSRPGLPIAAYRRLFQPELLKERCDQYLYLDTDTLVLGELSPFFEICGNSILTAVCDEGFPTKQAGLPYSVDQIVNPDQPYFNSGVLGISPSSWCSADITHRCEKFISRYFAHIANGDQDAINALLANEQVRIAPPCWNVQVGALDWKRRRDGKKSDSAIRFEHLMKHAKILHFVGPTKPWHEKWHYPGRGQWLQSLVKARYLNSFEALRRNIKCKLRGGLNGLVNRLAWCKNRPLAGAGINSRATT